MSPEAQRGEKVDRRADVYSMGVVLFVMLVGHGPLNPNHGVARYLPEVAPELDAAVSRALQLCAEDRFASGTDFLEALRAVPHTSRSRDVGELVAGYVHSFSQKR
jgi:serine/threonine protein kinase